MVKIVVSRKIPDKFYQQLSKLGDVVMWQKSLVPMPKDQFVTALRDADACFITLSEQIDAEILAQSPNLKVIANMAVGYDNMMLKVQQRITWLSRIHQMYLLKQLQN